MNESRIQIGTVVIDKGKKHPVYITSESPNRHILITGISGSGKSTRIEKIEQNIVTNGGTVIEFDINGTHNILQDDSCNCISVLNDGLDIGLFNISCYEKIPQYKAANISDILSNDSHFGDNQLSALRDAVLTALNDKSNNSDLKRIDNALQNQSSKEAKEVHSKLWSLFNVDIFHKSEKSIQPHILNILSFKGIPTEVQIPTIEIVMAAIWRKFQLSQESSGGLTIVLDEFQNLKMSKESTMLKMLKESRKYNINLILATQSLATFNREQLAALNQAAVQLFFQQCNSDLRTAASIIDSSSSDQWKTKLSGLKRGEAISIGNICIENNEPVEHPFITYTS